MLVEIVDPPPSYQSPLLVVSETTDRFRWPILQTRQVFSPPPDRFLIEGPYQSPPTKPRLRYHKQSYYTDTFQKPHTKAATIVPAVESRWRRPIGKQGEFYGKSTNERHYPWPTNALKMEDYKLPPSEPTVGLGIIPILGTSPRDKMDKPSFRGAEEIPSLKVEGNYLAAQRQKNPSYWVRNCNPNKPQEKVWADETTHRLDYVLYSKRKGKY
ncbi:hypothetical protein CEXT_331781 [Caerostris extrusa]|uniref:Uncharacterized protein n=1 Tax=Caerostris extrusa TaxID=172846 RepID=A0AAV4NFU7_CAEEX|nr:hypothetical protein CEXT_331781 [Caerostris extrusa]